MENNDFVIENGALKKYTGAGGAVVIPDGVTSIGEWAFSGCTSITSVTIPDSVASIGDYAFSGCTALTSVNIPPRVRSIQEYTFSDCSSLTSVTISEGVKRIETQAFFESGLTSLTLPGSVETIEKLAFYHCKFLVSVTLPEGLKILGERAFKLCESLTSVTIPDSVTSIEDSVFYQCASLASVVLPKTMKKIVKNMFWGCENLREINLPDGVEIDPSAFRGCCRAVGLFPYLKDAKDKTLCAMNYLASDGFDPEKESEVVEWIVKKRKPALEDCAARGSAAVFMRLIALPGFKTCSLDEIDDLLAKAEGNVELTAALLDYKNKRYSQGAVEENEIAKAERKPVVRKMTVADWKKLFKFEKDVQKGVTVYKIMQYIGSAPYIEIPEIIGNTPVAAIGSFAFKDRSDLTGIVIPDSVIEIGYQAFFGCTGLTSIVIPNTVNRISSSAFSGCTGLADENGFGILRGVLFCYTGVGGDIVIPNSVTVIGESAFEGCKGLTSVIIPVSVTVIEWGAFRNCECLTSVTIGKRVTTIGSSVFDGCHRLIIRGTAGSAADTYAKQNDISFEKL